jgi:hydroxymethylpyrimidine/phosphomethylpyrimidine kinase
MQVIQYPIFNLYLCDMQCALTIAGSDSGGGAGIQADLKTFEAFGVFGLSAITALTAQNTQGVQNIYAVTEAFVSQQLQSIFEDFKPAACKTGMLHSAGMIETVVKGLENQALPLIVDPVMVSTSGHRLLEESALIALKEKLLPRAFIVTPNVDEAAILTGLKIGSLEDLKRAGNHLLTTYPNAIWVMKGGHLKENQEKGTVCDLIIGNHIHEKIVSPFRRDIRTHGTGCTFSAAITAGIALGKEPLTAIQDARHYISRCIENAPMGIGKGATPLKHSQK